MMSVSGRQTETNFSADLCKVQKSIEIYRRIESLLFLSRQHFRHQVIDTVDKTQSHPVRINEINAGDSSIIVGEKVSRGWKLIHQCFEQAIRKCAMRDDSDAFLCFGLLPQCLLS